MLKSAKPFAMVVCALALGGCGAQLSPTALGLPKLNQSPVIETPPTDVYARIAAGALRCWFAPEGALKATHIFHADAAPPSSGGAVDIVVHERDATQPNPRGARAFLITILPQTGGGATVGTLAPRFSEEKAIAMRTDVLAWANGVESCEMKKFAPQPAAPPEPEPKAKKPKAVVRKAT